MPRWRDTLGTQQSDWERPGCHTPRRGRLLIRCGTSTNWRDTRRGIVITLADTGPGMPSVVQKKIFDAFYTTKSDGMGIGLSVSHSIIEHHGGRLWATLNDGPGATFSFSIPCKFNNIAAIHTLD